MSGTTTLEVARLTSAGQLHACLQDHPRAEKDPGKAAAGPGPDRSPEGRPRSLSPKRTEAAMRHREMQPIHQIAAAGAEVKEMHQKRLKTKSEPVGERESLSEPRPPVTRCRQAATHRPALGSFISSDQ